jgi:hypothetical protein
MKRSGVPSQANQLRSQSKLFVGIGKALQKPDAEEAGGSGNKNPATTELLPKRPGMSEHMLQIFLREWRKRHRIRG